MPKLGSKYKKYRFDTTCQIPKSTYFYHKSKLKISESRGNKESTNDNNKQNSTSINNTQTYFADNRNPFNSNNYLNQNSNHQIVEAVDQHNVRLLKIKMK